MDHMLLMINNKATICEAKTWNTLPSAVILEIFIDPTKLRAYTATSLEINKYMYIHIQLHVHAKP